MANQSKSNDLRFWQRWQESGAVENMPAAYERQMGPLRANEREVESRVQENQPLTGIEKALRDGCTIHAFLSGGGLRVVRIEQNSVLKGYGEHPSIDHALRHADDDFLAGGRDYNVVYGREHLHYLTGSTSASSPLDAWLRQGRTFDAYVRDREVVFELRGYGQTETPCEVIEQVDKTGQPVIWKNRGYTYETRASRFPNGEPCHSTSIIEKPEGRSGADPWSYKIVKTGTGKDFTEALERAFNAAEVEIMRDAA